MKHIKVSIIGFVLLLFTGGIMVPRSDAKLATERWTRLTEEERHQLIRAERYFEQQNFKNARSEYELFLQLYTRSETASYAQLMFAECTRQLGKVNTAIGEFRNVLDYFPDSIDAGTAQYSIGVCWTQTGDVAEAVKAFEKVAARWPKTEFGANARSEVCKVYWRLGQTAKWVDHMRYLATGEYTAPRNLRNSSQQRLLAHLLMERKTADAFILVEQAKPNNPLQTFAEWTYHAIRYLPTYYGEEGTKAKPIVAADAVAFIEKQPVDNTELKTSLEHWSARIVSLAGELEKTIERFAALTKRHPENDTFRREYAQYLRSGGKRAEARLVYRDIKDQYYADSQIAETWLEEKNAKRAVEDYRAMLEKHPDKVGAIQWRLGEILQHSSRRYAEAIACYNQSQREPQSLFRIAECQGALKKHDSAIQTLVSVLNFFKSAAPEAHYRMAAYHDAKGDKPAAIRTLKTVCKNYLKTPWAARAHQDLSLNYGVDVTLGGAANEKDRN